MSSVGSFLPSSSASHSSGVNRTPTAFEINAKEFGETGATVIGALASVVDGVSTTVSLSSEGLKRLADSASSALEGIETTASEIGSGISHAAHRVSEDLKSSYGVVEDSVESLASGAGQALQTVEDSLNSAADSVADAASSLKDGLASLADKASTYIAMGLSVL